MVFFARPSFARVATAQPASSDSDVGFCVRGRLCGGGEDASSLSDAPRPRAALFARLCGGPLMELAAAKTAQALGRRACVLSHEPCLLPDALVSAV